VKAAGLVIAVLLGMLFAAVAVQLGGCATPGPVPPLPDDVFAGAVVDCETDPVRFEGPSAWASARGCMLSTATSACMADLAGRYRVDTLACVARDLGSDSNEHVLAGTIRNGDTEIDNAARAWIRDHRIGYR
jgi:hypothetical protein